jgi:hypothetical protein
MNDTLTSGMGSPAPGKDAVVRSGADANHTIRALEQLKLADSSSNTSLNARPMYAEDAAVRTQDLYSFETPSQINTWQHGSNRPAAESAKVANTVTKNFWEFAECWYGEPKRLLMNCGGAVLSFQRCDLFLNRSKKSAALYRCETQARVHSGHAGVE